MEEGGLDWVPGGWYPTGFIDVLVGPLKGVGAVEEVMREPVRKTEETAWLV
jgi:hypothetical protein